MAKSLAVKLDMTAVFTSAAREVTMAQILDDVASWLTEKEAEGMMDEETGEVSTNALVAYLVAKGYWRLRALADDNARKARKEAPRHVYRARLGDVSPEAQAKIDAARTEAAKLAGIVLPEPAPKAPKAPPVQPLEAAMADVLAAPQAPAPKAPKARKVKTAPAVTTPAALAAPATVIPPGVTKASARKAAKAAKEAAKAAPAPQAPAPAPAPEAAPAIDLPGLVAWFRADLSRKPSDAIKAHKVSFNKASAAHKAAHV